MFAMSPTDMQSEQEYNKNKLLSYKNNRKRKGQSPFIKYSKGKT